MELLEPPSGSWIGQAPARHAQLWVLLQAVARCSWFTSWRLTAAADEQIEKLWVLLQAVARRSWFTSCLGLSDMPIPTPTEHLPPQSTRYSSCSSRGLHAHGV